LYLGGGGVSFVVMRIVGPYIDRLGAGIVSALGTVTFIAILAGVFVYELPLPVPLFFMVFMSSMAIRNMSLGALSTRVPRPHERARFMSIQSAVQHFASALGAFVSAQLLSELPGHELRGMQLVASVSIGLSLALPLLLQQVERRVAHRNAETQTAPAVVGLPEPRS
jgi:predicted MFS family arabinose efflux permease